jgi:adenylate cyclase
MDTGQQKGRTQPGREIERKFLLKQKPEGFEQHPAEEIIQGYLAVDPAGTEVRLRKRGDRLCLTIKQGHATNRAEQNVELTTEQWEALWPYTEGRRIQKTRSLIPMEHLVVEVDDYGGMHRGLLVAEVEFVDDAAAAAFEPPAWLGDEVTGDQRYSNRMLAC